VLDDDRARTPIAAIDHEAFTWKQSIAQATINSILISTVLQLPNAAKLPCIKHKPCFIRSSMNKKSE